MKQHHPYLRGASHTAKGSNSSRTRMRSQRAHLRAYRSCKSCSKKACSTSRTCLTSPNPNRKVEHSSSRSNTSHRMPPMGTSASRHLSSSRLRQTQTLPRSIKYGIIMKIAVLLQARTIWLARPLKDPRCSRRAHLQTSPPLATALASRRSKFQTSRLIWRSFRKNSWLKKAVKMSLKTIA